MRPSASGGSNPRSNPDRDLHVDVFANFLATANEDPEEHDAWVARMLSAPATVISSTLTGPLSSRDAEFVGGDVVDIVGRLKEHSEVPLRSHGSLSLNRTLMAAGSVDRVQVTVVPVINRPERDRLDLPGRSRLRP